MNSIVRKEYGKYEQKKTDKKVQADAIRDTAKLAASFLLPGGIAALAGQLSKAGQMIGKIADIAKKISDFAKASDKVFTAVVRGAVQVVDGTRNGVNGVAAGFGNAVLGYLGATGTFDLGIAKDASSWLHQSALGLGVSYDKDRGYGGMVGIGNSTTNASVGFYQHGATTLDASYGIQGGFMDGSQVTLSHSGNSTQVGVSYNEGRGDRNGFNYSLNYDIQQGMASGGVGYTIPGEGNWFNGMGINLNLDRYGLTSSAQYDGVNIASMGPAGFSMQEFDWAMLNINEAQDRQKLNQDKALALRQVTEEKLKTLTPDEIEDIANVERNKDELVKKGLATAESVKGLSPDEINAKLIAYEKKQNAENTAAGAATAGSLAFMMLGYLGLGRKENDGDVATDRNLENQGDSIQNEKLREIENNIKLKGYWLDPSTGGLYSRDPDGSIKVIYKDANGELNTLVRNEKTGEDIVRKPNGADLIILSQARYESGNIPDASVVLTHGSTTERGGGELLRNPQSSILLLGYNESIVKSLRATASDREKLILKSTKRETILNSEEGKKLKQAEFEAKEALETVKKSADTANRKYGEAVSTYTDYAEAYGRMVTKGELDEKTAAQLVKEKYDDLVKPAKDNLDTATKSIKTLTVKAQADVDRATKDTERYIQSEKASITEGINKTKILEAAKKLSRLESPDLDPKLKSAYSKVELAEKNLLNTKAEPGSPEHKKLLDAYLKEKKNFLKSEVGRDLAKQIDLADAPDVYKGQDYTPLSESKTIKDTQFIVEPSERIRIDELRRSLESREIQNPEAKVKVDTLGKQFDSAKTAYLEANKNLESLEADIQKKRAEMEAKQPPATDKELTKFESDMQKKIDAEKKNISDSQKEMLNAEKAYKAERMTALIKEDPNLLGSANPKSLDSANRRDTVNDLFYGKDDRDISSAANSLFDKQVTLGQTGPLASKVITEKTIATDSGMLPLGAGFVRYMDFYGERLMLPGVPGSPITSDFGPRTDPGTGGHATHLGADNGVQKGSVIGTPVKAEVFSTNNESRSGENSRHSQGFGKSVTLAIPDQDTHPKYQVRLTVGHNGEILVKPRDIVQPGQAISISSNSGRSIGNPGDHTHVEFSFYAGDDPDTGKPIFKPRVPTQEDIPLLKELGLIK